MERVKRLAGNEIELGIEIPMIESRASNIPMTKGITYVVMRSDRKRSSYNMWEPIYMSIQVPLLVIDWRRVSVMST